MVPFAGLRCIYVRASLAGKSVTSGGRSPLRFFFLAERPGRRLRLFITTSLRPYV